MKQKKTLLFLVCSLAVLTAIAITEERFREKKKSQTLTEKKLFQVDFETVTHFSIENNKQGPKISFQRVQDQWMITGPVETLADFKVVTAFLVNLQNYSYIKKFESEDVQKSDYGLDPSGFTIVVNQTDDQGKNQNLVFQVGDESPVGYGVYVTKDSDQQIYLGGKHLLLLVKKSLNEFRDKYFFRTNLQKMQSVSISGGGKSVSCKNESGCPASVVSQFLSKLKGLRANRIADLNEKFVNQEKFLYELKWNSEGENHYFGIWLNGGEVGGIYSPDLISVDLPFQVIEYFESVLATSSASVSKLSDDHP